MESSKPLHLTYFITGTQYGGATIGMVRLLSELQPSEFEITVVTLTASESDVTPLLPDHINVEKLDIKSVANIHKLLPLISILRKTDLLICSVFHATAVGIVLGTILCVPSIFVWQHNSKHANQFRALIYRIAYQISDNVLADSQNVKLMLRERYGVNESKIAVLPIAGIDTRQFRSFKTEPFEGKTTISTVGRLTEEKGYADLIRCAHSLGSSYQFHIAGDGPMRDALEAEAPDNITFYGAVPNEQIPEFLNKSDIYFQPSKREGLCMTVIEAMACELPVVASNVGGILESVVPQETGYLCNSGDVECFKRRIEGLGQDPSRRQKMGSAARDRVVSRYSQAKLADRFREVVDRTKTV